MGLNKDGTVFTSLNGSTPEDRALGKIREMHEELRQIASRVAMIEGQMRSKTDPALTNQNFSTLFWWLVSLMESFYGLTWAVHGNAKMKETIKDFQSRFVGGLAVK
jgi:hypothetical protein